MTADKVVAELTFGFWTAFIQSKQYAKDFEALMYAFHRWTHQTNVRDIHL